VSSLAQVDRKRILGLAHPKTLAEMHLHRGRFSPVRVIGSALRAVMGRLGLPWAIPNPSSRRNVLAFRAVSVHPEISWAASSLSFRLIRRAIAALDARSRIPSFGHVHPMDLLATFGPRPIARLTAVTGVFGYTTARPLAALQMSRL